MGLRLFRRKRGKSKSIQQQVIVASRTETISESEEIGGKQEAQEPTVTFATGTKVEHLWQKPHSLPLAERWNPDRLEKTRRLWNLTPEQYDKLLELKARISDLDVWKNDPHEAVRFLLEKRDNVDRAEDLFRRVNQWRLKHGIENILEDYKISPIFNYFPIAVLKGVDHDGDPIHLERPGAADCWSFYQRLGADEIYQMAVYMREMDSRGAWHDAYEQQHGHPIKHFTIIIDLAGLNHTHMRPALIGVLGRVLLMSQDQYPFLAKKIIMLRAPRIFKALWSIAQHFVYDSIKKMIVFSTQQDYLEVLDRYMDRSVLPACICPEEGKGEGTIGYEKVRMEGGKPPCHLTDEEIEELLEKELESKRSVTLPSPSRHIVVTTQPIVRGFVSESFDKGVICL